MHLKLNTKTTPIHSNRVNGQLVLIYLTIQPTVYNTQSTVAFVAPTKPGQNTIIPKHATSPATPEIRRRHKENKDEFVEHDHSDKVLKSQLICGVDEIYISSLRDNFMGHARVITLKIITYLYENYAGIRYSDLK